jgi:hypothetical protein
VFSFGLQPVIGGLDILQHIGNEVIVKVHLGDEEPVSRFVVQRTGCGRAIDNLDRFLSRGFPGEVRFPTDRKHNGFQDGLHAVSVDPALSRHYLGAVADICGDVAAERLSKVTKFDRAADKVKLRPKSQTVGQP